MHPCLPQSLGNFLSLLCDLRCDDVDTSTLPGRGARLRVAVNPRPHPGVPSETSLCGSAPEPNPPPLFAEGAGICIFEPGFFQVPSMFTDYAMLRERTAEGATHFPLKWVFLFSPCSFAIFFSVFSAVHHAHMWCDMRKYHIHLSSIIYIYIIYMYMYIPYICGV